MQVKGDSVRYKSNLGYVTTTRHGDNFIVLLPDGSTVAMPSSTFTALFTEVEE